MKKNEKFPSVREALEKDVPAICNLFKSVYTGGYPYPSFYDEASLKRSVFSDDILMLVAEHRESGEILGTASVIFQTGNNLNKVAEFGRLVVRPDARCEGIGKALMGKRIEYVEPRLHVGFAENRTVHSNAQRISKTHGFAPVGYLPSKLSYGRRESISLFVRYFGDALRLRANHPRIIPEAHGLAHLALENCGLGLDLIIDDDALSYPRQDHFELKELTSDGFKSLLQMERGQVRKWEIFGSIQLKCGFFHLIKSNATYLVARGKAKGAGSIAGAVGYTIDELGKNLIVSDLISNNDDAVRFLLESLLDLCHKKLNVDYLEVDVSTKAPQMQRTFLELGFFPVAYIPAMGFCDGQRVDILRMARVLVPIQIGHQELIPEAGLIADQGINSFTLQEALPRLSRL